MLTEGGSVTMINCGWRPAGADKTKRVMRFIESRSCVSMAPGTETYV